MLTKQKYNLASPHKSVRNGGNNMREEMDFLDRNNEFNCEHCYHNIGCDDFQHRLPCGQWHCFVTICCDRAEALDDEE